MKYQRPAPGTHICHEDEIKRSRFITHIGAADTEEDIREFINTIKATYPDARHHCSAYIYHVDGANPVERSSDDGEPSGTAGMPMLDVLRGSGMRDIVAVVVRYFGGIKLGTGGLVRAYSDAVAHGLEHITPVTRTYRQLVTITVDHATAGRIDAELRGRGYPIVNTDYQAQVSFTLAIDPGQHEELAGVLAALSGGELTLSDAGHTWVDLP